MNGPQRLVGLDVLRGAAILLVLGHHPPGWGAAVEGYPALRVWWRVGWAGVDLFFVLSGFLVGRLLFSEIKRTGTLGVRRFLARRAWKIWPPYLAFLCVIAAMLAWEGRDLGALLPNLVHVQNYSDAAQNGGWGHTWSLAVEEHFYLVLPLLLLLLRDRMERLPLVVGVVAAACLAGRIATVAAIPHQVAWVHLWPTHLRIDSLMAGVLLAWLVTFRYDLVARLRPWRHALPVVAAPCFLPALLYPIHTSVFQTTLGLSLLWVGSGCLVLWCYFAEGGPLLRSRPARWLAWVGAASYGIYLWHLPWSHRIIEALGHHVPLSVPAQVALFVGLAIALGWLMTLAVERPALALRERLAPRR